MIFEWVVWIFNLLSNESDFEYEFFVGLYMFVFLMLGSGLIEEYDMMFEIQISLWSVREQSLWIPRLRCLCCGEPVRWRRKSDAIEDCFHDRGIPSKLVFDWDWREHKSVILRLYMGVVEMPHLYRQFEHNHSRVIRWRLGKTDVCRVYGQDRYEVVFLCS